MNKNYSSPLWHGRLAGMLFQVAYNRGVRFSSNEDVTMLILLTRVLEVASAQEKDTINKLLTLINEKSEYEKVNNILIDDNLRKTLMERGQAEAKFVFNEYRGFTRLIEETDFASIEEEMRIAKEKKKLLSKRIIWSLVAVFVLGIITYNLPYFKENRAYKAAIKSPYKFEWYDYYQTYPNGRHYEDVMYHEITHTPVPVQPLADYLTKFPQGKYSAQCETMYEELWDKEIQKYHNKDKNKVSSSAVEYINAMLNHMKKERVHTVLLQNIPNISLKDYTEYDSTLRAVLELFASSENDLPLNEDNIVSLKKNFSEGDRDALAEILSEGVEKSFGSMFDRNFVKIVTNRTDAQPGSPVLTFEYVVKNQEDSGLPEIWSYKTNYVTTAYLLGIDVSFKARYTIPGSDVVYEYSEVGEPGTQISGIVNIKDGYRQMTQVCFAKFSNKMSANLGLEQTYFKGE